nr:hypothetical protein [uncultured Prevotella sp.]
MKEQKIKKRSYVRPLIEVTYVGLEHQLLANSVVTTKPEVVPPGEVEGGELEGAKPFNPWTTWDD